MDQFSNEELKGLLIPSGEQAVSLYLPTHRAPVEGRQDLIRFKNMLHEAGELLIGRGLKSKEAKEFLLPLKKLRDDSSFWQHRGDGLAVFYSGERVRAFRLPVHFEELVAVANRFHLKPLIPLLIEDAGFFILALSQNEIRLLQGNRYGAWEVELEHAPASLVEALDYDSPERQFQFHNKTPGGMRRQHVVFFSHGVGLDDSKDEIRRYFQQIDKSLQEVLRAEHAPLILAGVEYLFPIYREVNSYPYLLGEGIPGNPETLIPGVLHEKAWKVVVQPRLLRAREEAISQYKQLAGTGRTSREIKEIVPAAAAGRVEKLVVDSGVQIRGRFTPGENGVGLDGKPAADSEDLLDLAVIQTILNKGMVFMAEGEAMPDKAPAVALFRY